MLLPLPIWVYGVRSIELELKNLLLGSVKLLDIDGTVSTLFRLEFLNSIFGINSENITLTIIMSAKTKILLDFIN